MTLLLRFQLKFLLLPWIIAFTFLVSGFVSEVDSVSDFETLPIFIGWETEPAMDYGGKMLSSFQVMQANRLDAAMGDKVWSRIVAGTLPGMFNMLLQHEIIGHGGRAREQSMNAKYGITLDGTAYTSINSDPSSSEVNVLIASGGTEADTVLSHQLTRQMLRRGSLNGFVFPLQVWAKLDLSLYSTTAISPDETDARSDFFDDYKSGNDLTFYIVARQGWRNGIDPAEVWNRESYIVDYGDPLLQENYDLIQKAALWNLLDPSFWAVGYAYVKNHVIDGSQRVEVPVIPLAEGWGLTLGTRATLGLQEISTFLDVYLISPWALGKAYYRCMDSSIDTSTGYGVEVYQLSLGSALSLSLGYDYWSMPDSVEMGIGESGDNIYSELSGVFGTIHPVGFALKVGYKTDGYYPGLPINKGIYTGGGLTFSF